jgi:hypothetical protein
VREKFFDRILGIFTKILKINADIIFYRSARQGRQVSKTERNL